MQHLDDEFKILRYLYKPLKMDKLMLAHLDCLDESGNDYASLVSIRDQGGAAAGIPESIPWIDGKFDLDKVALKWQGKGIDTTTFESYVDKYSQSGANRRLTIEQVDGKRLLGKDAIDVRIIPVIDAIIDDYNLTNVE